MPVAFCPLIHIRDYSHIIIIMCDRHKNLLSITENFYSLMGLIPTVYTVNLNVAIAIIDRALIASVTQTPRMRDIFLPDRDLNI